MMLTQVPDNIDEILGFYDVFYQNCRKRLLSIELFGSFRARIQNFEATCSGIFFDLPKNSFHILYDILTQRIVVNE